jgi:CRP-like cAMP-binding protein
MPAFSKARLSGPVVAVKGSLRRASPALDRDHRTLLSDPHPLKFQKRHKGQQISDAIVLISGEIEAVLSGKTILAYRPGQLIGNVSAYSGLVSPLDVVARGPARLAMWDLKHMREFTESRPELRAKLLQIVSADLATKLHKSIIIEQVESESFLIGSK